MRGRLSLAVRVGFTYCGTIVGAGFASGQEILQFFSMYGRYAIGAILISTFLFSWFGTRMMIFGSRLRAHSFEEFNLYVFGPRFGPVMSAMISIVLFGVTASMLSGVGSLFQEQLGLSFHLGVMLTIAITYFVCKKGINGIMSVNSFVVPLMFSFLIVIGLYSWYYGDWQVIAVQESNGEHGHWLISAITYVAFNIVMAQAVLVPLGAEIRDEGVLRLGSWIGGLGLGFMLLASNYALQLHMDEVKLYDLPMAWMVSQLGEWMQGFFLIVIWAEIFTTLVSNVYGLTANLQRVFPVRQTHVMLAIFGIAYAGSLAGFSTLVHILYPLFGYCGFIIMFQLLYRFTPKQKVG
ncbi:putative membrane protein YkvI [Croceifilum oryzae]|uniref:Membrane protein YkvI n=1 Tax=Croceifilum oryzae TaxID=1553429 RepID=A0AAJ1TK03_9BACL|nr:hypothetical protein [Croceifilum oryzae]MDQ0416131.1 putative membrane protein YkvI [Croceifilum oryzae]